MTDIKHNRELQVELISITPEAEKVIEEAGRTCYQSFDKMGNGTQGGFIERLIKMGHESPLEHAYATFRIKNCSRAMTHQLVRHRLMAVCQQSQRYVDEENFSYVVPESIRQEHLDDFHKDMETIRQMYQKWRGRDLRKEDARFVLPNACTSEIVVSANLREWRHILKLRMSSKAQWEIRKACQRILLVLREQAPACFSDIAPSENKSK
ncbi:MAG: FAD-dependent thymidylate synthase [Planctomycetota bacterium]|jgi:thymidylate synthase (FAD)